VSESRLAHIDRVTALLQQWATAMQLPDNERLAWCDAGRWHDALRDASEADLRALTGDHRRPAKLLHGQAAAISLIADGEQRPEVLDAVRWHTTGNAEWQRTGRALYMADYLEPGRPFTREERGFFARQVPSDFDGVFREVVRHRLTWAVREGQALFDETVELWNATR